MGLIVSRDLSDLSRHAAENVCVIKGVLGGKECDAIVAAVMEWRQLRAPNQNRGENWWYPVKKGASEFDSFLFWQLDSLEPPSLRAMLLDAFGKLFQAHVRCNTIPPGVTLEEMLIDRGELPSLDPLIFHYRPGAGKFQRHAHEPGFQQTQVLINLTKRGRDYVGGATLIEEENGNVVELSEVFDQGDLFSFPYPLFHSVNAVDPPGGRGGIGRMSILMPFHPRKQTNIRY